MVRPVLLSLLVVFSLWPAVASATLVPSMSVRRLSLEADSVVRGEVVDEEVVWDGQRAQVYTHTTIVVREALVGRAQVGELMVLRQMGGTLDGLETRIVGTAELPLAAEVVLFTRTDGALHYLVGMAQGMWRVQRLAGQPTTLSRGPDHGPSGGPHPAHAGRLNGLRLLTPVGAAARPAPPRLSLDALRTSVAAARMELEVGQ